MVKTRLLLSNLEAQSYTLSTNPTLLILCLTGIHTAVPYSCGRCQVTVINVVNLNMNKLYIFPYLVGISD